MELMINCKKCKVNKITHNYLKLCNDCYKNKRKIDWKENEALRCKKDKNRELNRKAYLKNKYYSSYRDKRIVKKICVDCGEDALKGSHYSQCRACSSKRMAKKKVKYQVDRKKTHLPTKIREKLKGRLKDFLKSKNKRKDKSIIDFLGCSIPDFIIYLENLFQEGMSWDNYGFKGWHIDHIKPISAFDPLNEDDLNKMSHYTNLQPLWAKDNLIKGDKYDPET